jgi:hypothetical protein
VRDAELVLRVALRDVGLRSRLDAKLLDHWPGLIRRGSP